MSVKAMLDKQIDARLSDGMPPPEELYVDRDYVFVLAGELARERLVPNDKVETSLREQIENGTAFYRGVRLRAKGIDV